MSLFRCNKFVFESLHASPFSSFKNLSQKTNVDNVYNGGKCTHTHSYTHFYCTHTRTHILRQHCILYNNVCMYIGFFSELAARRFLPAIFFPLKIHLHTLTLYYPHGGNSQTNFLWWVHTVVYNISIQYTYVYMLVLVNFIFFCYCWLICNFHIEKRKTSRK